MVTEGMIKQILCATTLIALAVVLSFTVSACSCIAPVPPAQALAESDAVFLGTVQEVDRDTFTNSINSVTYTFTRSKIWKGPESVMIAVKTADNSASCGVNLDEGKEYLVYANYEEGENGIQTLVTTLCSRTALASDATEDIEALNWVEDPSDPQQPQNPQDPQNPEPSENILERFWNWFTGLFS